MPRRQFEQWIIAVGVGGFALGLLVALPLPWELAVGGGVLLLAGVIFFAAQFMRRTLLAARQLTDDVELMRVSNPAHRLSGRELPRLSAVINQLADTWQSQLTTQQAEADLALEIEKQRLASLLAQIAEGVVVSNPAGRILLYNEQARQLFANRRHNPVGLNRPLQQMFDPPVVSHLLGEIQRRHEEGDHSPLVQLITTLPEGTFVQIRAGSMVDGEGQLLGIILLVADVTQQSAVADAQHTLIEQLSSKLRPAVANIRAAIETLEMISSLDAADATALRRVVVEESQRLSDQLEHVEAVAGGLQGRRWSATDMRGGDLLQSVAQKSVYATIGEVDPLWLNLDGFATAQALVDVLEAVGEPCTLAVRARRQWAAIELAWVDGAPRPLLEQGAAMLEEMAGRYGGTAWIDVAGESQNIVLRLLLPQLLNPRQQLAAGFGRQPSLYDFDLFELPDEELGRQLLSKLTYTAFDSETTGLDPSGGDEMVSLAGLRIVNGRLLEQESFAQLINPQRPIPATATAIHGIAVETVRDAPLIDEVLPAFHQFAADTVLVGHNVAFDMRLLELKEARCGVRFDQPALDTLLLASVLYPERDDYSLEALGQLLGVEITHRHSAEGDAQATGRLFLRLLPLLEARGIRTLNEALTAAENSYLAFLRY